MNYLDLFSGIGGFALGAHRAGLTFDKHYFSEIDKYAKKIYQKHFPDAVDLGGVQNVGEGLGQIDLITFGFPCQDLSVAGKRAGLADSRSGLFFEATRLIRFYKPSHFIFENVAGLLTSNGGKDFETVLREIADIGIYECEWQLLNTSWFLPQNRERVYFIGHLGEGCGKKILPIGKKFHIFNEQERQEIASTIQSTYYKGGVGAGHNLVFMGGVIGNKNKKWLMEKRQNGRRFKNNGEPSFTLTGQDLHEVYDGKSIRRLTPKECERLQGFPDNYTEGLSDTQRYKCLGNAVTVDVVEEIVRRLYK